MQEFALDAGRHKLRVALKMLHAAGGDGSRDSADGSMLYYSADGDILEILWARSG
ncbi:hypothetical protein AB0F17_50650 [Nonomuraea sp. NPDC026600]|uniref:hypothetical protein n=1 Tax=Nonomuraea sp. NPDC026600 TaxID=3155363 RepID=UPI0033E957F7